MKSKTDQLDFDFSRPIDFQRNISSEIIDDCVSELFKENMHNFMFFQPILWKDPFRTGTDRGPLADRGRDNRGS